MSEDFLAGMAASSRARSDAARAVRSESSLRAALTGLPAPPPLVLSPRGFDLIAELKLRSPAAGLLRTAEATPVAARVGEYIDAGAAAISVLTEPARFDGSMQHLEAAAVAARGARVPVMRKDFLVDPYQVLEARLAGAGGVLVILRMLDRAALEALVDEALGQQLFVLLEAFDEADIDLARDIIAARAPQVPRQGEGASVGQHVGAGAPAAGVRLLVGINCRDLVTLQVVPGRLESLVGRLPAGVPRVAESGVASAEDAARLAAAGYDLALVGSALMTGAAPQALAGAMLEAGRSACAGSRR
jgi:indole-3-glycerol phosphate synthase